MGVSGNMNKKVIQLNTIVIPELESYREAGRLYIGNGKVWTEEEEAIMKKYYGFAPVKELLKFLPGRTHSQVMSKAQRLNLTTRLGK